MTDDGIYESLEEALADIGGARVLYLYGDELRPFDWKLPASIVNLVNLEELSVEQYDQLEFPNNFSALLSLTKLTLHCFNKEIPAEILSVSQLKSLTIGTAIERLPEAIVNLQSLTTLDIEGIELVDEFIGELINLKRLVLGGSKLTYLPDSIAALKNLELLNLEYSGMTTLPKIICRLDKLKHLNIGHTYIDELPLEIAYLKQLESLQFDKPFPHHGKEKYKTRVKQIRQSWCEIESLKSLSLSHQNIIDVSANIKNLVNLKVLDLSYNDMAELPVELLTIPNLRTLNLDCNQLTVLPNEIITCDTLETLSLLKNPIEELPVGFTELKNLRVLDVRGLPWERTAFEKLVNDMPDTEVIFYKH